MSPVRNQPSRRPRPMGTSLSRVRSLTGGTKVPKRLQRAPRPARARRWALVALAIGGANLDTRGKAGRPWWIATCQINATGPVSTAW